MCCCARPHLHERQVFQRDTIQADGAGEVSRLRILGSQARLAARAACRRLRRPLRTAIRGAAGRAVCAVRAAIFLLLV